MTMEQALAAPATTRRRRPMADGAAAERRWLLWPPLVFFLLTVAGPVVALVQQALSGEGNAFAESLRMEVFVDSVWRTLLLAAVVTVATVVVGTCYAFAIAVGPVWVKALLMGGLLISLWTSVMVRTIGWMLLELPTGALFWVLELLHLRSEPIDFYQSTAAMYPAMIAVMLPFAVLPVLASVIGFDREQLKAATVFGAGPLLTLGAVVLPAIRQAMISGGVLVFVMSLGFYVTPLLLGGPANMTMSGIINAQLNTANRADVGAAMSLLLVGGTVAIYLVADRLFKVSERWG
ncbi:MULTISPECIES: ABC transporter permease [Micromonospora]|uniref:ABC transporter permease n=1 Tax=Micromonospora TaxID=1873 RepID=UPI000A9B3F33|nr:MULTISPECIES: ABC transporter permease subunit [Micromonospora]